MTKTEKMLWFLLPGIALGVLLALAARLAPWEGWTGSDPDPIAGHGTSVGIDPQSDPKVTTPTPVEGQATQYQRLVSMEAKIAQLHRSVSVFWLLAFLVILIGTPGAFLIRVQLGRRLAEIENRIQLEVNRLYRERDSEGTDFDSRPETRSPVRTEARDSDEAQRPRYEPPKPPAREAVSTTPADVAPSAPERRPSAAQPVASTLQAAVAQLPQGAIAGRRMLALHREGAALAAKFHDEQASRSCERELGDVLAARLRRLVDYAGHPEEDFRKHWLKPDLLTCLNQLGRLLSQASEQALRGSADPDLAARLAFWLYGSNGLGEACDQEGWLRLDPVRPFDTRFDPQRHHSMGTRRVSGHQGLVVAIHEVGRWDLQGGAFHKARVTVGG